ncbi:Rossman fold protein, TIGR00730 family [Candidatus Uhrbacteria bacterium RIFCSPHIGHO2_12_FULL_60_25]|uniref:Cytokinin riboside 5'-monophosphate phosphoribohydrolase n=1 Tax=Candidatus Uhrbacteria bacterium RIFCSPHIGHO2_12_FULL_60_25 TaxID=1802399 RepID=A0A1F7UMF3_9BACT|nr:MAG: Rossman fold protein, TIGR00730 family [Candidatus Uhrbacteria bacterium RIFCSPHIGHO2_02_FULL_60_44]OGL79442.1 MAG: Rossman fold protein, TIGR00730 family [Candidatus Uhrbacteria bacterium RIFCSPHIGHO2_12_FULL_60_25]
MPKKMSALPKSRRALSDEGARRKASWGKPAHEYEHGKRYTKWLCDPGDVCRPMDAELGAFQENPNWKIFRIMAEFVEGFEFLDKLHGEVTIFGSARAGSGDPSYKIAKKLGALLGKEGYTVVTGGGPGIMEAANWGAFDAGGESVGLDIELPSEQRRNQFVRKALGFHYFFTRKVMLSASAQAYVFFPGGFGTLDEMTEMVTLIQTGKIPKDVPAILVGKDFWQPFVDWVTEKLYRERRYISKDDIALLRVVDSAEEAMAIIRTTHERPYGSERQTALSRKWEVKGVGKKK